MPSGPCCWILVLICRENGVVCRLLRVTYRLLVDGVIHGNGAIGLLNLNSARIPLRFRGRFFSRGEPVLDSVEHDEFG